MSPRTYDKTFLPLESNPEIFTSLAHNLGLSSTLRFTEVYDLDETPKEEVLAYVLAFPTSEIYHEVVEARDQEHFSKENEVKRVEGLETNAIGGFQEPGDGTVLWLRQNIHNACGLYALLHATCNGPARNHIGMSFAIFSVVSPFLSIPPTWLFTNTGDLTEQNSILHTLLTTPPSQHSSFLFSSTNLESFYNIAAKSGDTPTPEHGEEVNWHYTAFVPDLEGTGVLELDGDRWGPLVHGGLDGGNEGFGDKARRVIREEYFESEGMEGMFSVLALVRDNDSIGDGI